MMALSKRHFDHFAVIIAALRFVDPRTQTIEVIQNHLASLFEEQNPRFDRKRWEARIDMEIVLLEKQKNLHETRSVGSQKKEGKQS